MAYIVLSPEMIPYVSTLVNLIMSCTPLLSYGSTVLSIRRKQSSQGFSIDICGTMLISSILRIFYFFNEPFELTLLRQCFIMVFIQIILLKVVLKYRSEDSIRFEKFQRNWEIIFDNFIQLNKEQINETFSQYNIHDNYNNLLISNLILGVLNVVLKCIYLNILLIIQCILELFRNIIRLFDYHYIRPFNYWQWRNSMTFWKFLVGFIIVLTILQFTFYGTTYFGLIIGSISFLTESTLPIPQILLFQRLKNVENFKIILLLSWLGGDVTKISYLFYGTDNVGTIFKIAAFFQMSLNFIITYQFFYYKFNPNINREYHDIPMTYLPNRTSISRSSSVGMVQSPNQNYHRKSLSIVDEVSGGIIGGVTSTSGGTGGDDVNYNNDNDDYDYDYEDENDDYDMNNDSDEIDNAIIDEKSIRNTSFDASSYDREEVSNGVVEKARSRGNTIQK